MHRHKVKGDDPILWSQHREFFAGGNEPDTVLFHGIKNCYVARNDNRTEEHMDPYPYGNINQCKRNDGGDGYQILHLPRIEHHNTSHSDTHMKMGLYANTDQNHR